MKPKRLPVDTAAGPVNVTLEWPDRGAAWYYRFKINGKRFYRSTDTDDLEKATQAARQAAKDAAHSSAVITSHTLPELVAAYLKDSAERCGEWTQFERKRHLGEFQNQVGNFLPQSEEAATTQVQKFISDTKSPFEYRKMRLVLSAFFTWIMQRRQAPWRVNPASANFFERRPIPRKVKPVITEDELRRLLIASKPTPLYPSLILILSGLRPVSLDRVTWESFTWDPPRVRTFEKRNERLQALSEWAGGELKQWKEAHPEWPVSPKGFRAHRLLKCLRELMGLSDHITLQGLRRYADFYLYQKGISPQIAAKVMDHLPSTAQKHYVDYQTLDASAAIKHLDFSPLLSSEGPKRSESRSDSRSELKPKS